VTLVLFICQVHVEGQDVLIGCENDSFILKVTLHLLLVFLNKAFDISRSWFAWACLQHQLFGALVTGFCSCQR